MEKQRVSIPQTTLQRIWHQHGLGDIKTIREPAGGVMNQLYIVNEAVVIRLNPNALRYENEAMLYRQLVDSPVPVPRVLAVDTSRSLLDYDYLITSKIDGASVHDTWHNLTPSQQQTLGTQAGQVLAHIHTHRYACFGKLHRQDIPDWTTYVMLYLRFYRRRMRKHVPMIGNILERIQTVFETRKALLNTVTRPTLVHSDFHTENLMQRDGQLTGVIDWEWAFVGDAAWDFAVDYHWQAYRSPFGEYVRTAYEQIRPLDADADERIALYRLLPQLEDAVWTHVLGDNAAWEQSFAAFLRNLRAVEAAS